MSKATQILSPAECQKLITWLRDGKSRYVPQRLLIRDLLITLLMLDAGLRVGEVVLLKVHDLFFGDHPVKTLIIRKSVAKGGHERCIPMSERLEQITLQMYNIWRPWREAQCTHFAFSARLLTRHITVRSVQLMLKSASHHALGFHVHPHILRHTFATRLMQKTSIRVVQKLLGHASLSSTQIYTHPNSTDLTEAIKAIS